ncbi:hypothetical protein TcCL_NonESM04162 [Trypanosoma cruzi]|nr:hypothetical protein TcCL_NonESM04162 [Trypanosoma cruzi]
MNSAQSRLSPGEAMCALYAASAADSACSISCVHIFLELSRLPRGMWRSAARKMPPRGSNHVDAVERRVSHNDVKAGQSALRRTKVAFFRQGSVFASRGVPSTISTS